MPLKKCVFENESGHRLTGLLDLPKAEPEACALFAHCFTCTKNLKSIAYLSRALTGAGLAVFRFDFTGLGESEGEFSDTNFSSNVSDLISAADHLTSEFDPPKILIGHSLGGAAVLQAASEIPSAAAVVTIAAPHEPAHLAHLLSGNRDRIEADGEGEITLAGRKFRIKKQFFDDLEATRMEDTIRNLGKPLLVLHAPGDKIVGIHNGEEIFGAARHPKGFISLDGADHLLTEERDARDAGSVIAAWAGRYIG